MGGEWNPMQVQGEPLRITIPAGTEFDEGKRGPWLKVTWADFDFILAAVGFSVDQTKIPPSLLRELETIEQSRNLVEGHRLLEVTPQDAAGKEAQ